MEALPLPKAIQRAAARKTEVWEAKVESRLQEQKKTLSKQQPSRSTLVDELWLEKQGREESSRQNEYWRRRQEAKASAGEQGREQPKQAAGKNKNRPARSRCDEGVVLPLPREQVAKKAKDVEDTVNEDKVEDKVNGKEIPRSSTM